MHRQLDICDAFIDEGTHEAIAVHPEHAIGGHPVRILEGICAARGYPKIIRSDNAKVFTGRTMFSQYTNKFAMNSDSVTVRL